MSLIVDLSINDERLWRIAASNIGGDLGGECEYYVSAVGGPGQVTLDLGHVKHHRPHGAVDLAGRVTALLLAATTTAAQKESIAAYHMATLRRQGMVK